MFNRLIFCIIMFTVSKNILSPEMKKYLQESRSKYIEKCIKKKDIVYVNK